MRTKTRITVLGAGRVGSAIVKDLAEDFTVTAVDRDSQVLQRLEATVPVTGIRADLRTAAVAPLVADADLVICAVPGFMGFDILRQVIEAGKDVVDISFFPEDPFALDQAVRERGVTAVVDCGVAPGLSNIIAGYVDSRLERVERYTCYVGGLPKVRRRPYEYKAVFSPSDVLEEYIRPARLVEHGEVVVRPALSEVELVDFAPVGTLEAFNTDGLRTLIETLDAPFMREKTLRYPGHAALMRVFRETGFFSRKPIETSGGLITPLEVSAKLLSDRWRLEEGEEDFTVMRVIIEGSQGGRLCRYVYDLWDEYDRETGLTSMARTTGYTCTIVARQVLAGLFTHKGIAPPEYVGRTPDCFEDLLTEYARRGIHLTGGAERTEPAGQSNIKQPR